MDRKNRIVYWTLLAIAAVAGFTTVMLGGCGANDIPAVPYCDNTVTPCPGSRNGTRCAVCQDANASLSCQFPGTGQYALCVASCGTCDGVEPSPVSAPLADPGLLVKYGVSVCWPAQYRASSYCGVCRDLNATLATELCDGDGFCDPVVCVADCNSCPRLP